MGSSNSKHTPAPPSEDETCDCAVCGNDNKLFHSDRPSARNVRQCSVKHCKTTRLFVEKEKRWVVTVQPNWNAPYVQY
ncbi:bd719a76-ec96-437b-80dd-388074c2d6b3-CDS [Sclerotinia trifoliorum]|uniref:Bd719a76-ec96-437b-80dd-388074c2d6b3-CDS n=1 Tax=Sclerotinia trifoliorum TaxID=28548 RepID=A0A8H2VW14_9HELO|nr:bd719a76-ec96-437b-80dd-388074c2d6b3-CDS [Sclerotinia trifoliorum]